MSANTSPGLMSLMAHNTAHGHAHHRSAPVEGGSLEEYGYDGFPGNPVLTTALIETRAGLLVGNRPANLGGAGDIGYNRPPWGPGGVATDGLPALESVQRLVEWGAGPRASLATFELLSGLTFTPNPPGFSASLYGIGGAPIATVQRPDRSFFAAQLDKVDSEAGARDRRYPEILSQVAPPIAFYASVLNLRAHRHRRTMELVNAAIGFANTVVMRFKHALDCPRPSDYSIAIQPLIEVPPHASFPAGHACEGQVIARVFGRLVPGAAGTGLEQMLSAMALRIAHNRIVAGLHFPVDNLAGRLLGDVVADYFIARCQGGDWQNGDFSPALLAANPAAAIPDPLQLPAADQGCSKKSAGSLQVIANPILAQMWTEALAEWQ